MNMPNVCSADEGTPLVSTPEPLTCEAPPAGAPVNGEMPADVAFDYVTFDEGISFDMDTEPATALRCQSALFAPSCESLANPTEQFEELLTELEETLESDDEELSPAGQRVLTDIIARTRHYFEETGDVEFAAIQLNDWLGLFRATEELSNYEGDVFATGVPTQLMDHLGNSLEDATALDEHYGTLEDIADYLEATEPYRFTLAMYGNHLTGIDPDFQILQELRESHPFLYRAIHECDPRLRSNEVLFGAIANEYTDLIRQLARVDRPLTLGDLQRLPETTEELQNPHFGPDYLGIEGMDRFALDYLETIFDIEEAKDLRERWDSAEDDLDLMLGVRSLAEVIGQHREGENDGEVLLASLRILELWGTGGGPQRRTLLRYDAELTQALQDGDRESVDVLVAEITAWIPSYMQTVYRPRDSIELATGGIASGMPNRYVDFLATRDPQDVTVGDVARFGLSISLGPHGDVVVRNGARTTTGPEAAEAVASHRIELDQASLIYNRILRERMVTQLDQVYEERYGTNGLAEGLPPQDDRHDEHAIAFTTYYSRPVADAYAELLTSDASDWETVVTNYLRLSQMASVVDRMNSIWDVRDIVGQYDDPHVLVDWDERFMDEADHARFLAFGEESLSRLGLYEDQLAVLADARTPEERVAALAEVETLEDSMQGRFGTEFAYFDELLGNEDALGMVGTILEMNEGRDRMAMLIEVTVLTIATFGVAGIASRIGTSVGRYWVAFEGAAEVTGTATRATRLRSILGLQRGVSQTGELTRLGRIHSALQNGFLFHANSVTVDALTNPGQWVGLDSTTGQDAARISFGFIPSVTMMGTLEVINRPFARIFDRLGRSLRNTRSFWPRLQVRTAEAGWRLTQLGAEVGGISAESVAFESTVGQASGLWGDPTHSLMENFQLFCSAEALWNNFSMVGIMRSVHLFTGTVSHYRDWRAERAEVGIDGTPRVEVEPLSADDFGAHYRLRPEDFPSVEEGPVVRTPEGGNPLTDGVALYPIIPNIAGRVVTLGSSSSITFTGRVFGQGSASTVYEATLSLPSGETRRVAVKIPDHGRPENYGHMAQEAENLQWAVENGLTDTQYYGMGEIDGMPVVVSDVVPGVDPAFQGTIDPAWITRTTIEEVFVLYGRLGELGVGVGDLQFTLGRDGHARLMDFEGLRGNRDPHQALEGDLINLREQWGRSRDPAEFDAMVAEVRAEHDGSSNIHPPTPEWAEPPTQQRIGDVELSDAPIFARSDSGGAIIDNGNGQLTKVGDSEFHRAQLDAEQAALGVIQYNGLDIGPRLIGRPAPSELIISRIDGRPLDEMSVTERQAIPEEAWTRMEGDLGQLRELGIQHGDINPGNILWDGQRLHIIDFGRSRLGVSSDRDVLQARGLRDAIAEGLDLATYYPIFDVPAEVVAIPEVDYLVPEWARSVERPATLEEPVPVEEVSAEQVLARTGTDDQPSIAPEGDAEAGIRHFVGAEREPNYMSDRNRTENRQAAAIVRSTARILRQNGIEADHQELSRTYHDEVAPLYNEGGNGRNNRGNLESYDAQVQELVSFYSDIAIGQAELSPLEVANRWVGQETELQTIEHFDSVALDGFRLEVTTQLEGLLGEHGVASYEQLAPQVRTQFEDIAWPALRDNFVHRYYEGLPDIGTPLEAAP